MPRRNRGPVHPAWYAYGMTVLMLLGVTVLIWQQGGCGYAAP